VSNINKTTKSFDKTPQLSSYKKSSLKRKLNWEVAEHQEESSKEKGVFIDSGSDDNCNKKGNLSTFLKCYNLFKFNLIWCFRRYQR